MLLVASLALLAMATLGSLVVLQRTGEMRVGLLTALFLMVGVQQAIALPGSWGRPLDLDLATASAVAGLCVGLLGLLSVVALHRTLRELERAEALHWDIMEGVRGLTELAARHEMAFAERLDPLLQIGCERLGLEIGLVSRVVGNRYEVLAIHAPATFPIGPGAAFELGDTFCAATLESDRPLASNRTAELPHATGPGRNPFPFEAYIGCAIRVHGQARGTLAFGSLEPRTQRFTASHKELLLLMSQWLGAEREREELAASQREQSTLAASEQERRALAEQQLEQSRHEAEKQLEQSRHEAAQEIERSRREAAQEIERSRREASERTATVAGAVRRARLSARRAPDLNAVLSRVEKRLRRRLPAGVELVVERGEDLAELEPLRLPIDAILMSLVRRAAEAMSGGGRLTVRTANHESREGEQGVMAAVPPARYVTVSVSESSGAVDADALNRLFDVSEGEASPGSEAEGGLSLAAVYRLLQRVGADLSMEVEPGHGSRFVLFLPLAEAREEASVHTRGPEHASSGGDARGRVAADEPGAVRRDGPAASTQDGSPSQEARSGPVHGTGVHGH